MSFANIKEELLRAKREGYALGAFNTENMEMVKGVIQAAEELRAPVMIQTTTAMIEYGTVETYAAMIRAEAEKASVPVCLHLDHGASFDLAVQCIVHGYQSVMYDGSKLPYEENVRTTKAVVEMADAVNIPTEAELGAIGGKEDGVTGADDMYTDPQQARDFAERTGIFSLAVAIGTVHGFYKETPKLDIERLEKIRESVDLPLVLHGSSGLSDQQVKDCIAHGICKVNFATELRCAYTHAIEAYLKENPGTVDPKLYGVDAIAAVKEAVKRRILVCGCAGKAD